MKCRYCDGTGSAWVKLDDFNNDVTCVFCLGTGLGNTVPLSIEDIGEMSARVALERGFPSTNENFWFKVGHLTEEVGEIFSARRKPGYSFRMINGKPEGVLAELADVILLATAMGHELARVNGVPSLETVVRLKHEHNQQRADSQGETE